MVSVTISIYLIIQRLLKTKIGIKCKIMSSANNIDKEFFYECSAWLSFNSLDLKYHFLNALRTWNILDIFEVSYIRPMLWCMLHPRWPWSTRHRHRMLVGGTDMTVVCVCHVRGCRSPWLAGDNVTLVWAWMLLCFALPLNVPNKVYKIIIMLHWQYNICLKIIIFIACEACNKYNYFQAGCINCIILAILLDDLLEDLCILYPRVCSKASVPYGLAPPKLKLWMAASIEGGEAFSAATGAVIQPQWAVESVGACVPARGVDSWFGKGGLLTWM